MASHNIITYLTEFREFNCPVNVLATEPRKNHLVSYSALEDPTYSYRRTRGAVGIIINSRKDALFPYLCLHFKCCGRAHYAMTTQRTLGGAIKINQYNSIFGVIRCLASRCFRSSWNGLYILERHFLDSNLKCD